MEPDRARVAVERHDEREVEIEAAPGELAAGAAVDVVVRPEEVGLVEAGAEGALAATVRRGSLRAFPAAP